MKGKTKFKLGLKLNLADSDLTEVKQEKVDEETNFNLKETSSIEKYNKGLNLDIFNSFHKMNEELSIIDIISKSFGLANYLSDYSYHWVEKSKNIQIISEPFKIFIHKQFQEPKRDIPCEYELIKLLTEDDNHKDILLQLPKSLKRHNRYSDILPYKYNTIFLSNEVNNNDNDSSNECYIQKNYVNASYITDTVDITKNIFVSTQGPTTKTINTFWKMIVTKGIRNIIMLCNLFEDTRKKCDQYWPNSKEDPLIIENISVQLLETIDLIQDQIIERKMKITISTSDSNLEGKVEVIEHFVSQFHVICWPDHSIPSSEILYTLIETILHLIDKNFNESNSSPVAIHCSAGVGRTGTMITIYLCYSLLKRQLDFIKSKVNANTEIGKEQISKEETIIYLSIFTTLRKLREQRYLFVTDICQYRMIYQFIYQWIRSNCSI